MKKISRQLEALARVDDVLAVMATSGNSKILLRALKFAKRVEVKRVALFGNDGCKLKVLADLIILIHSGSIARIQEEHILIEQILCELIEQELGFA